MWALLGTDCPQAGSSTALQVEVPSEDPYHAGAYGVAYTQGLQWGDDPKYTKAIGALKHYTIYSVEAGRGSTYFRISAHDIEDTYLPQFKAPVTEAKSLVRRVPLIHPACAYPFHTCQVHVCLAGLTSLPYCRSSITRAGIHVQLRCADKPVADPRRRRTKSPALGTHHSGPGLSRSRTSARLCAISHRCRCAIGDLTTFCTPGPPGPAQEPCCASKFFAQQKMRDEYGFQGYVQSDCGAVSNEFSQEHWATK